MCLFRTVPVPDGFIISTGVCNEFFARSELPDVYRSRILIKINELEATTNTKFGSVEADKRPLIVSVRASPLTIIHGYDYNDIIYLSNVFEVLWTLCLILE